MAKLNKNILAATAAIAVGGGASYGIKEAVFNDAGFKIDNSPAVQHKLEKLIKPNLQHLGAMTLRLAKQTESKHWQDNLRYSPEAKTVTLEAEHKDPVFGYDSVSVTYGAKPGTRQPNPKDVRSIKVEDVYKGSDNSNGSTWELAAPGALSRDKDLNYTPSSVYSASASGNVKWSQDASAGGAYLLNTRDNEGFVDSSYNIYPHNPVPTAKAIVENVDQAADHIRMAFDQPPK